MTLDRAALASRLLSVLASRVDAGAFEWLASAVRRKDCDLAPAFAAAARRVGTAELALTHEEAAALCDTGLDWPLEGWSLDDAARAALLLAAATRLPLFKLAALVEDLYRHGDARERAAIARCLALLPAPASFVALARQAARCGVPPVVAALARGNPYPSRYFPGHAAEALARRAGAP